MKIIRPLAMTDARLISSTIAENDHAAYASGTTYADGDRVIVTTAGVHKIYESLQNANTGHDPTLAASSSWWVEVSATNRWAMFDSSLSTQSTDDGTVTVVFVPGEYVDSVALFNVSAQELRITITDETGTLHDETYSLADPSGVDDWWAFFFDPITRKADHIVTGLPMSLNATITATLTDDGTVACGALVPGLSKDIGGTRYGASVGIQDYSIKEVDQWGNYYITERAYAKRASYSVLVENGNFDAVHSLLASYRATPVIYSGSDDYGAMAVYGFFKDFAIEIAYPTISLCTLQVEGLT